MITPAKLEKGMRERGMGDAVIERVPRLNPNGIDEGMVPRGLRGRTNLRGGQLYWRQDLIANRRLIGEFGRSAWDAIPTTAKVKQGKGEFLTKQSYIDLSQWLYAGKFK